MHIHDQLVVLDLDRTLLQTTEVTRLLFAHLATHGVSEKDIAKTLSEIEGMQGASVDVFSYITERYPSVNPELIAREIISEQTLLKKLRSKLLCEGAEQLIAELRTQHIPFLIMTYGEKRYQAFKVQIVRLLLDLTAVESPAIITDAPNKADWISEHWFSSRVTQDDKNGRVPGGDIHTNEDLHMKRVIIIDDKIANVTSTDKRVMGILVDNATAANGSVLSTADVAEQFSQGVALDEMAHPEPDVPSDDKKLTK